MVVLLAVMALGLLRLDTNLSSLDAFRGSVESVHGQQLLAAAIRRGRRRRPTCVVQPAVEPPGGDGGGREGVRRGRRGPALGPSAANWPRWSRWSLTDDPYSGAARTTIVALRTALKAAAGAGALVGGRRRSSST